ncbi:DUF2188 domain-containing protein [Cupriavidus sp. OTU4054]|uniref:DUF2188 domain-containing protein n=1 Tax=unclassified Cupriavidus TaxID=2640874 RepID=UPI00406D4744
MTKTVHVVRSGSAWVVQTSEGYLRTKYITREAAILNGAALAAKEGLNIVLHDRHGKIGFRLFPNRRNLPVACRC